MDINIIRGKTVLTNAGDVYSGTLSVGDTAYVDGGVYLCKISATNTTISPTININSIGNIDVKRDDGSAMQIGDLPINAWAALMYELSSNTLILINSYGATSMWGGFLDGSVIFIHPNGTLAEDNANFFWDITNHRLGIGTTTPSCMFNFSKSGSLTSASVLEYTTDTGVRFKIIDTGHTYIAAPATDLDFLFGAQAIFKLADNLSFAQAGGVPALALNNSSNHVSFWTTDLTDGTLFGTIGTHSLTFRTNNIQRLFIDGTSGNIGIGTITPNDSAALEISSTTGALLIPRMTTTQRDALTAVNGMLIYNSTTNTFQKYENGAWVEFNNYWEPGSGTQSLQTVGDDASGDNSIAISTDGTAVADDVLTIAFGSNSKASNNSAIAFGYFAQAYGNAANAFGEGAVANINQTTNLSGPLITKKTSALVGANYFNEGAAAVITLTTEEVSLTSIADYTITIPAGAKFYPDEVDLIVTTVDGTITTQPTIRAGITGTLDFYLAAVITADLGTGTPLFARERKQTLLSNMGNSTITAGITIAGVKNTATVYKGRFVFRGLLIESE